MENNLYIYNTLSRKKEKFEPLNPPFTGMYVCGPTVYGDAHLGHARPAVTFDLVYRYLRFLGYKVRYVRNITDVGHLVNDADEGEDKIAKKAKLDQVEPMEIVQKYTNRYHRNMHQLNTLDPNIEPHASAHIMEQIEMVDKIMKKGYAYEVNGSVYFDVVKYSKTNNYGVLSGRILEDLISNTRELEGQSEKKSPVDFALWKKANPEHIMRWPSQWSDGFPGWHLECSVMSTKYLGEQFDIHGGGLDLQFPHHECEIAQTKIANGKDAVRYWMHNNLITIDGQKMSKSLNNFIKLDEVFSGKHELLEQAYSPQTVRFFMLQAHYRNPLDFSNKALQAAEKALERLMNAYELMDTVMTSEHSSFSVNELKEKCFDALNDDFNTPTLIAHLFEGVKRINLIHSGNDTITSNDLEELKQMYKDIMFDIMGLQNEKQDSGSDELLNKVMDILLTMRIEAKGKKDFVTSDTIRNRLLEAGIEVKDTKDGFEWTAR
jgi:cysteinyl-tRNA synthetase